MHRNSRRLGTAAILLSALGVLLFRNRATTSTRPSATAFRAYLADPAARMVAYSPEDAVTQDPRLLRQQLALLRTKFDGLSLYQCTPATVQIVQQARSLGFRAVLLTVWDPRSESELANAGSIVRDEAGSVALAISIGSEGLMEKRYTLADMLAARAELLDRATTARTVEMTTTEPWWLYLHPENAGLSGAEVEAVRNFGDFTSINIHVVWDADILDPELAASWTRDRANDVRKSIPRPLLVREAGFPGDGSTPRDGRVLVFNRKIQAAFWQAWFKLDGRQPIAVFEAVDNPQKHWRDFESSWGLLSTTLDPWPAWGVFPQIAPYR
jgi:exo-beta-1,3-glucanase (GH17 family)